MKVTFDAIRVGSTYSRTDLARMWDYAGIEPLARGVVTPRDDSKIILFVTREKQDGYEQYRDALIGDMLEWEGPTDHFAEDRIINAEQLGEAIHLFYRERHHSDFVYCGLLDVVTCQRRTDRPSTFVFRIGART